MTNIGGEGRGVDAIVTATEEDSFAVDVVCEKMKDSYDHQEFAISNHATDHTRK